MTVIPIVSRRSLFRANDARRLIEWYTEQATRQCALAVHVLPEEMLADRDALTACLTEELRVLSHRIAEQVDQWHTAWEKAMDGKKPTDLSKLGEVGISQPE